MRSFLSKDWRRSGLGIPLRIHQSRINRLTNSLTNNRLSRSRRKMEVKARASVLIFRIIRSFNNNWCRRLKSLFGVDLTVVTTNHLRNVSGHAPRKGSRVTIGRMHRIWLIWNKSILIINLGSKVWRQPPRIGSNMPTRTRLTDRMTYHRLNHSVPNNINRSGDNNGISNHSVRPQFWP